MKKMIECKDCHNRYFEGELKTKEICFEQEYGVSDLFDSRTIVHIEVCPNCGSRDLIDLEQCDCCEEWFEELHDTEGLTNGNIGYVCDQCFKDNEVTE